MRIGILSDTHDELARTQRAIAALRSAGVSALVHCGDLSSPPIVAELAVLPSWFVFGNHDGDMQQHLKRAAAEFGVTCLGWGGVLELAGRRIGVAHGHLTMDIREVLKQQPEFLMTGHSHEPSDTIQGLVRRINPGALFRADQFTVAVLDLETEVLELLRIDDENAVRG